MKLLYRALLLLLPTAVVVLSVLASQGMFASWDPLVSLGFAEDAPAAAAAATVKPAGAGQAVNQNYQKDFLWGDDTFPKRDHPLLPQESWVHVAYGEVDPDEAIQQPIAYSHKLHAGDLKLDCQYCHTGARRSIHAGVPPTATCMNCHILVDPKCRTGNWDDTKKACMNSDAAGEPRPVRSSGEFAGLTELEVVKAYFDRAEPIPWVKVHDLPDFVYFSHKRHILGGLQCQECHGDIATYDVPDDYVGAKRVNTLEMGWCLNCHATHPKVDENYGADAEKRRAELKDCWTCHK